MRRLLFATLPGGHFWSYGPSWTNINVRAVLDRLSGLGYLVDAVEITSLLDKMPGPEDVVVYTSSEDPEVRQYIKDVIYLAGRKCKLIPGYESLLAHENKGFQQLYREQTGFGNLRGGYGFESSLLETRGAKVFKLIAGAGSKAVEAVRNARDVRRIKRKYFSRRLKRVLIDAYRRLTLPAEDFARYKRRKAKRRAFAWQDFVPDLDCDYKVLVFGDRFYALRRGVRDHDFRASGSGRFSFERPPDSVLDFARSVHRRLKSPYCSLDIVQPQGGSPSLVEYQCLSFGPYTVIASPGYFTKGEHDWVFQEATTSLEDAIVHAIRDFLTRMEGQVHE